MIYDDAVRVAARGIQGVRQVWRVEDTTINAYNLYVAQVDDAPSREALKGAVSQAVSFRFLKATAQPPVGKVVNIYKRAPRTFATFLEEEYERLMNEREALIAEGSPFVAGFIYDLRDPLVPEKAYNTFGGKAAVSVALAQSKLPVIAGVMPTEVLARSIEASARKAENLILQEPLVLTHLIEWSDEANMPVVAIGLGRVRLMSLKIRSAANPVPPTPF